MKLATRIRANQYLEAPITDPHHLVNKQYVDDLIERNIKPPVRLATIKNLLGNYDKPNQNLTAVNIGELEIDGIIVAVNDRILVKDQIDTTQNGIYIVVNKGSNLLPWVLKRSSDFNASEKISKNLFIRVSEGESNSDILFQLINDTVIILDTSPIIFMPYKSGGDIDVQKYVGYITGNGTSMSFMISHNLNSEDLNIIVRHINDTILVDWDTINTNVIRINFDTPLEDNLELKITIFG